MCAAEQTERGESQKVAGGDWCKLETHTGSLTYTAHHSTRPHKHTQTHTNTHTRTVRWSQAVSLMYLKLPAGSSGLSLWCSHSSTLLSRGPGSPSLFTQPSSQSALIRQPPPLSSPLLLLLPSDSGSRVVMVETSCRGSSGSRSSRMKEGSNNNSGRSSSYRKECASSIDTPKRHTGHQPARQPQVSC